MVKLTNEWHHKAIPLPGYLICLLPDISY